MIQRIKTSYQLFSILSIAFYFFVFAPICKGQNYRISLITCDPGSELYSTFGHSALRVIDSTRNKDLIFNYGTFNTRTPNFYLKFMKGQLPYYLSVAPKENFMYEYLRDHRSVREQVLNLDSTQIEFVITAINENLKPENVEYPYDFFYDNCATRLEGLTSKALEQAIDWGEAKSESVSFRNLLDEFLTGLPWSDFGIDLVIGSKADQEASITQQMFLPEYLEYYFAQATVGDKPLISENINLMDYQSERLLRAERPWFNPLLVFWSLLILCIILILNGKIGVFRVLEAIVLIGISIVGGIIIFLWFFTDHGATALNWNLIWANPLYLLLLGNYFKNWQKVIAWFLGVCNVIIPILFLWIPQYYHPAFLPIQILLLGILFKVIDQTPKSTQSFV